MFSSRLHFHLTENLNTSPVKTQTAASGPSAARIEEVQSRITEILSKCSSGVWVSKIPQIYREMYWEDLNTAVLHQLENWPHVCTVSIDCRHCGRSQYPAGLSVHLPNVILCGSAFPYTVCSSREIPALPLDYNNAFKTTLQVVVVLEKVSPCGLLEQVLQVAEMPPLTVFSTNKQLMMLAFYAVVLICSPLHFMLFFVGGFISSSVCKITAKPV